MNGAMMLYTTLTFQILKAVFLFDSLQFHQSQPWVGENKIDWWWDGSSHSR
jgi:hypothetical protein